jgi:hypothetical protein
VISTSYRALSISDIASSSLRRFIPHPFLEDRLQLPPEPPQP